MQADERPTMPGLGAVPQQQASLPATADTRPPPHPLDGQWYLHAEGQTYGPYSGHQIKDYARDGRVMASSTVMAVGSERWVAAADEPRLAAIFREAARPAPPRVTAEAGATVVQVTNQITPAAFAGDIELSGGKSPGIALVLSLVICGIGQMYNGQVAKGILMLLGSILLWLVMLGWIVWIWSMIDAYQTAKAINARMFRLRAAGLAA
ncbi:GYF domain-containing protein [Methylobacterium platani]|uniref:GYF domain-containing protein n=1 Tax=Methylobacterium platani JCM 14648 TaxID=1295136 RepID=A0ABR5GSF7_9HYPH|nr:GYF domain-containing protein [Methylobacterium platani]KMO12172.1 hypothetical protein SQ03_25175 [Methylobacterium platani JCM 14648]